MLIRRGPEEFAALGTEKSKGTKVFYPGVFELEPGVFELEAFYPASERNKLAMMLNNILAAPGFASWLGRYLRSLGM
jgi:hypothetical protein